jgi:hypothetical protein
MRIEPVGAFGESVIVDRDPGDENDVPTCRICGERDGLPRFCDWRGDYRGLACDECYFREPGDSYYEDTGSVRHELQGSSGVWRR